jgi:hypothetical protein
MHPKESKRTLEFANTLGKDLSALPHSGPIPVDNSKTDSSRGRLPEVEIDFAELQDGSLVEMIEDPSNPTKSLLAVYKDGIAHYAAQWPDQDRILMPLSRADENLKYVRLPQGAEPYVDVTQLGADVWSFFRFCLDVDDVSAHLMTAFVVSTWFPEQLSFAPYLSLVGPGGSGKSTALRILGLVCRRSLLTADITSAAFYDVCDRMHPTLLIDETLTAGDPRKLLHLLRSSSSRGFVALRKDQAHLAFGPKVLAWVTLPNDAPFNSRCVIIPMHKTSRTDLKSPDDPKIVTFAETVCKRLLQFRFEHYRGLSIPKVPADVQLSGRPLDLYRALALPFGGDLKFCEITAHFIAAQSDLQPSLLSPAQGSCVRVLHALICEFPASGGFRVRELTDAVNVDLASRGEPSRLNERKFGDVLTSLGLTNRTRKNVGYVLWLNRADRERIHQMARDYGVGDVPTDSI